MACPRKRAAVVVLGDVGRSPRMQYHALSLADQAGLDVDLVAYSGTDPHVSVLEHPNITLHLMNPPFTKNWPRSLYLVALPIKILVQLGMLLWLLCVKIPPPDFFVTQNPPSIPSLAVLKLACWIRRSLLIIDWHNFGYTLLGLTLRPGHPLVRAYFWYERYFGKFGDAHLCVTRAMQLELQQNWGIRATLLYDRAPVFFRPATSTEKAKLFQKLHESGAVQFDIRECCKEGKRPALVVSSTSWTADEDFSILLEAAVKYDRHVAQTVAEEGSNPAAFHGSYPHLLIAVTGKGPLKAAYEDSMHKLGLQHVTFQTMWLAAEDYPVLLGSADLGVSLHTSSSGVDLPMKVVDMFGCGLPVCAMSYSCIGELVRDRENGLLFSSSQGLFEHFVELFPKFPSHGSLLDKLRAGAVASGSTARWNQEWGENVLPLIKEVVAAGGKPRPRQVAKG